MQYSYKEVIDTIENSRRFGKYTGYEVSLHILENLGHPQKGLPFVHVAGTNGKGSTTAFLCQILENAGMKVGMFTSPHLVDFEERIRINGEYIPKEEVTRIGNWLLNAEFEIAPTMFDYCLAMAVLYFKEQKCDVAVMETGIGGRYDSTNALGKPEVAVITKIGMDHTAILGDTLEAIAGEKAGIMKAGCPVVTTVQKPEVMKVLLENFRQVHGTDFYEVGREDLQYVRSIPMKMLGGFQIENAATAVLAAKVFFHKCRENKRLLITDEQQEKFIREGIAGTFWKGRMELVKREPFLLIDGAHNAHGVHALAGSLKELYPAQKFHFIMGVMADKDYEEMIEELLPLALDFTTVTPESSRALQAKELAECITAKGIPAEHGESVETVLKPFLISDNESQASDTKNHNMACIDRSGEKTVAFGSLYFIGEIEALFLRKQTQ